ncbi:MAG: hypothetical protein C5S48_06310 [Candidatus Methanogaster sp.]|nr:MAG: hypothetical protein C5S48_06310 [ANME-2 cluster archaeon]
MDFIDQIKELSIKISEQLEYVKNEEATKTALSIHSKKYGKSIPWVETTVQSQTKLPKPECQLPLTT